MLDFLGALASVPPADKTMALSWLLSTQDPADGFFKDPLVTDRDHEGPHSWEQIYGQWLCTADAIRLLGGKPRHALPRVFFADPAELGGAAYTDRIDWRDPWAHGETWTRGLLAYLERTRWSPGYPIPKVVEEAVDRYEERVVDPDTGMPLKGMTRDDSPRAVAGLFKTMNVYLAIGRPVPFAERAIDFTLALQHPDGDWGYRRNMCIVWDSLWVLRELNTQLRGAHRFDDIRRAGNRTAELLLRDYRKPDGGFAFHGENCITNHHSIRLCDRPYPIGDTMGTRMALFCLSYVDEWNRGEFRSQPLLD